MTTFEIQDSFGLGDIGYDQAILLLQDQAKLSEAEAMNLVREWASTRILNAKSLEEANQIYTSFGDLADIGNQQIFTNLISSRWPVDPASEIGADISQTDTAVASPQGAYGMTPNQMLAALTETPTQRRRFFESRISDDMPPQVRRFLERRFDPLQALFQLRQAQGEGLGLAGEPELAFTDFLNTASVGQLGGEVQTIIDLMTGSDERTRGQQQFIDFAGSPEGANTAFNIGLQSRLASVPESLRSFVLGRQNFRSIENVLNEALGTPQGFQRFATPGGSAPSSISNLLNQIQAGGPASGVSLPGIQSLYTQLAPTTRGEEDQASAFNIALQSMLQNTPYPFRSGAEQQARRQFQNFLVEQPGTAFLPYYMANKSFLPGLPMPTM
jgi:hypothetical protein